MRDENPSSRRHILDHPQAEGETEMEPHRKGNDFSWKAVAATEWVTVCHALSSTS